MTPTGSKAHCYATLRVASCVLHQLGTPGRTKSSLRVTQIF